MYYERGPTLIDLVNKVLSEHNKTEEDILYVRLKKKNDNSFINVSYKDFIETNGNIRINTNWTNDKILLEDECGGMRVVLKNGDYLRVWEYDSSTGLEYIDMMPTENVEIFEYIPFEVTW